MFIKYSYLYINRLRLSKFTKTKYYSSHKKNINIINNASLSRVTAPTFIMFILKENYTEPCTPIKNMGFNFAFVLGFCSKKKIIKSNCMCKSTNIQNINKYKKQCFTVINSR